MTTQQTKWGPEIAVNGKRPEWLDPREIISGVYPAGIHTCYKGAADSVRVFDWSNLVSFRLPADHPHYARPEVNGNSRTPTPSPELTARMVGAIRELAARDNGDGTVSLVGIQRTVQDAVEIAAELEPVNGDEAEIQKLLSDFRALGSSMTKGQRARSLASAALARGRALAEAGK